MKLPFIAKPKNVSRHSWRKFIRLSGIKRPKSKHSMLRGLDT